MEEYILREQVDDSIIITWQEREEQLTKMIGELSFELEHVKYKIELARKLNDARAELVKTMGAKPGEPGYAPTKYDF